MRIKLNSNGFFIDSEVRGLLGKLVHVHSLKDRKSMFPARQGLHIGNEENRTAIVLAIAGLIELLH